jgi:ATP-dependent RNA helicase DeaD
MPNQPTDGHHPAQTPPPHPPQAPAPADSAQQNWASVPADVKDDVFESKQTFEDLGLRGSVLKGLKELGFVHPTKIQSMLIPAILAGKDVLGQAKTGTGKTAAFGLPILHKADKDVPFGALILVPTRELCLQVAREINDLGQATPIRALAVYGGERIKSQVDALAKGPQIIVSTPGRLMDMVERGHLHLNNVKFAVLDEVDRMLDIGFRDDIRRILSKCPPPGPGGRQTIFVSATISHEIEGLARKHSHEAQKVIAVTKGALTTALVKQFYLAVNPWDKRRLLLHLLTHEEPALTVVFCRMKRTVDEVCKYLMQHKVDAHAMHGDMMQNKRNRVIDRLHKGDLAVLVASDLASRGLDIEGITHVINYDLPEDPEVYVHRIGRTARIGREGVAWTFVTPEQGEMLTNIEMLINMEIPKLDYPDFKPSAGRFGDGAPGGPSVSREPKPAPVNRYAATVNPTLPVPSAPAAGAEPGSSPKPVTADPSKFPGGIVPTKLPPKRMFGRVKTNYGIKQAEAGGGAAQPEKPAS